LKLLLDTHAFLWWLADSPRLSRAAIRAIEASTATVFVSAASIWEIAIKLSLGKLRWRTDPGMGLDASIDACGFRELAVTARHAAGVRELPLRHGDPFDRLLVSQALAEGLHMITSDAVFTHYGIATVSAED
jgi:PIN domain nuclease of toxin-antitoxin system